MPLSNFLQAHASHRNWRVAVAEVQRQLQAAIEARAGRREEFAPLTLGWCYLTDYYAAAAETILGELRQALPGVAWIGTAGIGVAASGVEYFDEPAISVMVAPLPHTCFRVFSGRQPLPAASRAFVPHTAQVHAEGSTVDLQDLLKELSERTATGYLFGGLSSARERTMHLADGVLTGGVSGVAFSAEVDLISRVTQGCQPIGPARQVTRAESNMVISLDGKPALDCAKHDLGLDRAVSDEAMLDALSGTLVGLSDAVEDLPACPGQFGVDTVVRHLMGVDPEQKILAVAEQVEPGTRLAFCRRNAEAAKLDLVRIATEIRDDLESGAARHVAGALYVSCSGRGGRYFGARNAELQIVRHALGDVPLVGFFAGGEIARHHLYGYTGVLTVFAAPN